MCARSRMDSFMGMGDMLRPPPDVGALTDSYINVSVTNMKSAKPPRRPGYRSPLREEQVARTRERIERAAAALINTTHNPEAITFKAVAERAGVTEMTVYRHFPTREDLLRGLWRQLNTSMGPRIGMPAGIDDLL